MCDEVFPFGEMEPS